jgi:hypothetical protein
MRRHIKALVFMNDVPRARKNTTTWLHTQPGLTSQNRSEDLPQSNMRSSLKKGAKPSKTNNQNAKQQAQPCENTLCSSRASGPRISCRRRGPRKKGQQRLATVPKRHLLPLIDRCKGSTPVTDVKVKHTDQVSIQLNLNLYKMWFCLSNSMARV